MKRIFLIGPGPSAAAFEFHALAEYGQLIGVNDCGFLIPECGIIISMDRKWLENRWDRIRHLDKRLIIRECVWNRMQANIDAGLVQKPNGIKVVPVPMDHTLHRLSLEKGKLNGRNSGFCAFNWTVQQLPDETYLFGLDMRSQDGKRHWHPPYPWSPNVSDKYRAWATDFDNAFAVTAQLEIMVYNCSATSLIDAFPRLTDQKQVMDKLR